MTLRAMPDGNVAPVQNTSAEAAARGHTMGSRFSGPLCSVHRSCCPDKHMMYLQGPKPKYRDSATNLRVSARVRQPSNLRRDRRSTTVMELFVGVTPTWKTKTIPSARF